MGRCAIDRAIDYTLQIAGALAASHSADIIHRDLKPANVMVTREGLIKVLDFGLAKWTTEPAGAADAATVTSPPHTGVGAIVGSSGYMSPEQALGQPADARSDVFSFGVVLYELLAGRRAFYGESEWSAINALVHDQPTPLLELRLDVPEALAHIVGRCLEKDRARRYPSAVELLDDLRRLAPASATARPSRTARYLAAAAVVALAVVIGITWVMVRRWQSAALVERSLPGNRAAGEPRPVCRRVSARTASRGRCTGRSSRAAGGRRCDGASHHEGSSGRGRVFQGLRRRRWSMAARRSCSDQRCAGSPGRTAVAARQGRVRRRGRRVATIAL